VIQSLKVKTECAINEKLLIFLPIKSIRVGNMVGNETRFFEVELLRAGEAATGLTTSVQQNHPAQDSKRPFLTLIKCVP
jgi:hypothetical protein